MPLCQNQKLNFHKYRNCGVSFIFNGDRLTRVGGSEACPGRKKVLKIEPKMVYFEKLMKEILPSVTKVTGGKHPLCPPEPTPLDKYF